MSAGARKKVVVVGCGYVGFPLAVMLARAGHEVVGVDLDRKIVEAVNGATLPVTEEDVRRIFAEDVVRRNLSGRTEPVPADAFIIAVATPVDPRKKVADLSQVVSALESILPHLRAGNLLVIESTVPPLTCREVVRPRIERATGLHVPDDVMVAHCPERILPGDVFREIVENARIVGGMDARSARAARDLYASFVTGGLHETDDATAELVKLMENTYRDVNIALANELSLVAETIGVDIARAIDLANLHPRVHLLAPGIGVGGHCIPVDPWFIREVDPKHGEMIATARRVNDAMPERTAARVRRALRGLVDPAILALGAAYKPDTYDKRESPALEVVHLLREDGFRVDHRDPLVAGMSYDATGIAPLVRGADVVLVLVPHRRVLADLDALGPAALEGKVVLRF